MSECCSSGCCECPVLFPWVYQLYSSKGETSLNVYNNAEIWCTSSYWLHSVSGLQSPAQVVPPDFSSTLLVQHCSHNHTTIREENAIPCVNYAYYLAELSYLKLEIQVVMHLSQQRLQTRCQNINSSTSNALPLKGYGRWNSHWFIARYA